MGIDSRSPLPRYITTLIQVTAKKAIGRHGFTESDQEDIEQQIAFEVLRRRSKFDPAKAQEKSFLARLVEHAIADIIAARKAGNRDYRREDGSLDQWVKDDAGKWAWRADTISEEDAGQRVGRPSMPEEELRDQAIDLSNATAELPEHLRNIFEHYRVLGSARAVARATGLHHSSVCDAIEQIRQRFEQAGLSAYLPKSRPNPTDTTARW